MWEWMSLAVGTCVPMMERWGFWVPTIRRLVGWYCYPRCVDKNCTTCLGLYRWFPIWLSTSNSRPCQTVTEVSLEGNCETEYCVGLRLAVGTCVPMLNNILSDVKVTWCDDSTVQWTVVMYLHRLVVLAGTLCGWAAERVEWLHPIDGYLHVQCIIHFVRGFDGVKFRLNVFRIGDISNRRLC